MPVDASPSLVQSGRPFGRLEPRRSYTLPLDQLHPVIRVAHRRTGDLVIPERIIFDHELVLILRGCGAVVFGGERVDFAAGDLLFIPPFTPHRIESGEADHLAVHFDLSPDVPGRAETPRDREAYDVHFPRGLSLPRRVRLREADAAWRGIAAVVELCGRDDDLSAAEAAARLMQVIVALLREPAPAREDAVLNGRNRARFERAVAWLHANLHRDIGVDDIADAAGLSASHLRRVFPRWTGYSPNDYLRRARVARAKELLADVDLGLKEIAAKTGFKDPFHFSKVFRQVDGLPPSRYREALLAGRVGGERN